MEIKYIKSASRLLDRALVNKGGLDLSKEVLWVSVGQRVAELGAVKVGGQKRLLCGYILSVLAHITAWAEALHKFLLYIFVT